MTEDSQRSQPEAAASQRWSASPAPAPEAAGDGASAESAPTGAAADRPEAAVGAAFAGGFVLALILKRLAR